RRFLPPPDPPRATLFPYTTLFRSAREGTFVAATTKSFCEYASVLPNRWNSTWYATWPCIVCRFESASVSTISREICRPSMTSLRSEEHTSELQSRENLVCRLLLEK